MPSFSAAKPDSVANWNLYPIAPSSRWNAASWLSVRWRFQLNDGEQLYASSLPGYSRRIASENCFASARSGLAVSNHSMSAYGAYARARAIAASTPSLTTKNPSGERSPVHQRRSYSSTSLVRSAALFASVRAIRIVSTPHTSAARRADTSFAMNSLVGTSTLPPRWPHFFTDDSWRSEEHPAAPSAIICFMSSYAFSTPPKPASASAPSGAFWMRRTRLGTLSDG